MQRNRRTPVTLIIGAMLLALLSLPVAANAWTSCHHGGGCTTCFFYSDDGQDTYQGYIHHCPRQV